MTTKHIERVNARIKIIQCLYQWQLNPDIGIDIWEHFPEHIEDTDDQIDFDFDQKYYRCSLEYIVANHKKIDKIADKYSKIPLNSLDPVEHGIIWLALWEVLQRPDVHTTIIINEAIELAKKFGAEGSYKFINEIIDKIVKNEKIPNREKKK